ncbi:MAG: energy-coupling factor transporter ATPase [Firmicutes bacterium]|nr:energy-coupling factor transporter ATPase [Bacillota bacterium]
MTFLKFENVSFFYGENKILNDITFSVKKGEFIAITGRNGSGKSTLAKHINGLILPSIGNVFVNNINTKDNDKIFEIRKKVGFTFQDPDNQIIAGTVEEDVAFGPSNLGVPRIFLRKRVDSALKTVNIIEYKTTDTNKLSGGNKQKLILAGALAMGAECLVLDEPTSMLDPESREKIFKELIKLKEDKQITIILLTHNITYEAKLADRIFKLENGSISQLISSDFVKEKTNCCFLKEKKVPSETILRLKNVYYRYDKKGPDILKNFNLEIKKGDIIGIIGKTGSGKSTFACLLKGIFSVTSGKIFLNNKPASNLILKEKVGISFQYPENQLFEESILKDVSFGPKNLGFNEKKSNEMAIQALKLVKFNENKINCSPFTLSGGEKRLAAIAGILAMNPEILILDEPTAGLDMFARDNLLNIIFELNKKTANTLIFISHSHEDVKLISDKIFSIENGNINLFST